MASVTIRLPDDLKAQMDAHEDVNWSEVLRDAVEERLRSMRRQAAARRMDDLREKVYRRSGRHSDMSEDIIRWRRLH